MGLFDRQVARKPDRYPFAQKYVEAMQDGFWTAKKFSFDSDVSDFELRLTAEERQMLTRVLAAIAQIEIQVKTFWPRLGDNLPHPSITDLGITMGYIEVIHNNAYEKLLMRLGLENVFQENLNVPALADRVAYLSKHNDKVYGDDRKQYIYSLILFTLFIENVSLFSQFFVILHMNRFGNLLKDAAQQVKYTRNEELLHAQAGTTIVNTLRKEYPELFDADLEKKILDASQMAYDAECALIDWFMEDVERIGFDENGNSRPLNAAILKSYVGERLNVSLKDIGLPTPFYVSPEDIKNTFWMTEGLLASAKVDFFHSEPTSYQQADQTSDDEF